MSDIRPIIDPDAPAPDPEIDPDGDAIRSDDIREPVETITPVEPDPEENRRDAPPIHRG